MSDLGAALTQIYQARGWEAAKAHYEGLNPTSRRQVLAKVRKALTRHWGLEPKQAELFQRIVGYQKGADPRSAISRELSQVRYELYERFRLSGPIEKLPAGRDHAKEICAPYQEMESGDAQRFALERERHKLALAFYLQDLDAAPQVKGEASADSIRDGIQQFLIASYDPRVEDGDNDGFFDCQDVDPLDDRSSTRHNSPTLDAEVLNVIAQMDQLRTGRLYVGDPGHNYYYVERGPSGVPLTLVVPIFLAPIDAEADVTRLKARAPAVNERLNALIPKEYRTILRIKVIFETEEGRLFHPDGSVNPHQVARINSLSRGSSRAHAITWGIADSDSTLAHEILHRVGLADKYHERHTRRDRDLDPSWPVWADGDIMQSTGNARYIAASDLARLLNQAVDVGGASPLPLEPQQLKRTLARLALARGDQAAVSRMIRHQPDSSPVELYYLGLAAAQRGDLPTAVGFFLKAEAGMMDTVVDYADRTWFTDMGDIYVRAGRKEEAYHLYHELRRQRPGDCRVLFQLWKLGPDRRWPKVTAAMVIAAAERQLAQDPHAFDPHYILGLVHARRGSYRLARQHLEATFVNGDSRLWETLFVYPGADRFLVLGEVLERLGEPDLALTVYLEAAHLYPQHPEVPDRLVRTVTAASQVESVLDSFVINGLEASIVLVDQGRPEYGIAILEGLDEARIAGYETNRDIILSIGPGTSNDPLAIQVLDRWPHYKDYFSKKGWPLPFEDELVEEHFNAAILAHDPFNAEASQNLIELYLRQGMRHRDPERFAMGLTLLDEAAVYHPQEFRGLSPFGLAFIMEGETMTLHETLPFYDQLKQAGRLDISVIGRMAPKAEREGNVQAGDLFMEDLAAIPFDSSPEGDLFYPEIYNSLYRLFADPDDEMRLAKLAGLFLAYPVDSTGNEALVVNWMERHPDFVDSEVSPLLAPEGERSLWRTVESDAVTRADYRRLELLGRLLGSTVGGYPEDARQRIRQRSDRAWLNDAKARVAKEPDDADAWHIL